MLESSFLSRSLIALLVALYPFNATASQNETVFSFHLPSEPHSLNPARLTSTDASYFFNNIMRGLYSYSNERGLEPEGAESCDFKTETLLECRLAKNAKWSDGQKVVAADYVRAFQNLLSAKSKNPAVELLQNLKNAKAVHAGSQPLSSLGVRAKGQERLIFEFHRPDPDFLYKLTTSLMVPIRSLEFPERAEAKKTLVNGPYRIREWLIGRRLHLEPNPFYTRGNPKRPPLQIYFVDDDQTALNLYLDGTLTLLRRLPTHYFQQFKSRPDFRQSPVARFDYVGFGEELRDQPDLRAALSLSADFRELQKIYNSVGVPGCPSLPEDLIDRERCVRFDLAKAKTHWQKVPEDARKKRIRFLFSKLGGDDIKKGAEWFQAQWKKNLGAIVDLEQTEQGVYLQLLRRSPPPVFRKGVGLERPTCLAALETFAKEGSENFLRLDDPVYERIIARLAGLLKPSRHALSRRPSQEARSVCGEGVQYLIDRHLLIPLGRFHFTLLADPKFTGWTLNEMNQLDLAHLSVAP